MVTVVKSHSLPMFGQGKKNGGGAQYQKARRDLMDRVRGIAALPADQKNDWPLIASSWDQKMAEAHGDEWPEQFAQIMQNVLNLLEGETHTPFRTSCIRRRYAFCRAFMWRDFQGLARNYITRDGGADVLT